MLTVTATPSPMSQDWLAWHDNLTTWGGRRAYPDPTLPGGLPEGWRIRAMAIDPTSMDPQRVGRLFLVSRDASRDVSRDGHAKGGVEGWGAVRHTPEPRMGRMERIGLNTSGTVINHHAATLAELYAAICGYLDDPARAGRGTAFIGYEQMIRETIVAAYDDTDPVERAERMLVALGARPCIVAAALL